MKVKVPTFQIDQDVNGFILTSEYANRLIGRFYSEQKKLPCYDNNKNHVGDILTMTLENGYLFLEIEFFKPNSYTLVNPVLETSVQLCQVNVS